MRLSRILSVILLSSVASSLSAQAIVLRGKVEDAGGPSGFVVDCTDTFLTSSTVNLNTFVGQHVLLRGTRVASPGARLVDVTSLSLTPETFEIPGNPEVDDTIRFAATHTPGSQVAFYVSLQPGFLGAGRAGTLLLDPRTAFRVAAGTIPSLGRLELSVAMPNDATLIGRTAYAQAAIVSGGVVFLSNPDCKTIR